MNRIKNTYYTKNKNRLIRNCSSLQQLAAPHCTRLHHTAPHCATLCHTVPHCTALQQFMHHAATHCRRGGSAQTGTTMRYTETSHALHCNTLQEKWIGANWDHWSFPTRRTWQHSTPSCGLQSGGWLLIRCSSWQLQAQLCVCSKLLSCLSEFSCVLYTDMCL